MKLVRWGKRNAVSPSFHAKRDEETIAARKLDLDKVFRVFDVRSVAWVMTTINLPLPKGTSNNRRYSCF